MNQETLFDIADSIEKLFSKIESTNKEKWKENQKAQVERGEKARIIKGNRLKI